MKFLRLGAASLLMATATLALTATAGATTPGSQLDQSSSDTSNTTSGFVSTAHAAVASQTFTAGVSGQLTDVTLSLWNENFIDSVGDIRVAIHPVDGGGAPVVGVDLAVATIVSISSLSLGGTAPVDFVFPSPASLSAGITYAITASEVNAGTHEHVWWAGANSDTYTGGGPFDSSFTPSGDLAFQTSMIPAVSPTANAPGRAGYCLGGTFVNLVFDQPNGDVQYAGMTPAIFVRGVGITCGQAPAGYAQDGFAGDAQHVPEGLYPYYAPTA